MYVHSSSQLTSSNHTPHALFHREMTSSPPPSTAAEAADLINTLLSGLENSNSFAFDNPRRFSGYALRLKHLVAQLLRSFSAPENLPSSAQTALKGIAGDLAKACESLSVFKDKSKIFVLIYCKSVSLSLQEHTVAIGNWLALLDCALDEFPDLRKKCADLSRDMKQAVYKVTENEERVHCTLQKEGEGRPTTKAVQSAIVMDLARALGIDSTNYVELSEQVRLLRNDLSSSNSLSERRILVSLERSLDSWAIEPDTGIKNMDFDFEDDAHLLPFKNFLCPLTKEVMKDPVVLESWQTYERTAIKYWFQRCIEDGREPTCPVTGQMLKSLDLKPNIGLAGAIEEWINRNVEIQVKWALEHLEKDPPSMDNVEKVLDSVYKISEDHPSCRYKVRNAGIVVVIVKLLRNSAKSIGSQLRSKALMALLSMSRDEESKNIMLEEGITRLAIHSLTGSSEKERECAVRLLLEFCRDEAYCRKIASEKGALVLLTSISVNLEFPTLSNLAEDVLKQMEKIEDNVQHLAAAGRFEPLLDRLCDGSENVRAEMASMVGRMTLTNSSKELIARQSAKVLVQLLSSPEGRLASLQALYNLSNLDDNATVLVDSSVLPALTDILFSNVAASSEMKELAASTIANIVSNPGHWELATADKEGSSLQSGTVVSGLLGLLSNSSPKCQASILQILCGIALSPQASESVAANIKAGDGIKFIIPYIEHSEVEHRTAAFSLIRMLSEKFDQEIADELRLSNKLALLKEKLLDNESTDGERSDSACILANLPLCEAELKSLLSASFVKWTVSTLKRHRTSSARISKSTLRLIEGLLGLLLHLTRSLDPEILGVVKNYDLMNVLREQLGFPSKPRVKQLAAIGLKKLSESRKMLAARDSEPQPPHGFFSSLVFMCWRASPETSTCPIHNAPCEEGYQLCLLRSDCIRPLVDLLADDDTTVQIAAMEALATLILDSSDSLKRAVDVLEPLGVVDALTVLFAETRPGELQEKTIWMIERILRVENQAYRLSLNQSLVRALVEAFRHGNANTKRYAQDALTNLKQISGVSGHASSQARTQR